MKTEKLQSTSDALEQLIKVARPPKDSQEALLLNLLMAIEKITSPRTAGNSNQFHGLLMLHSDVSKSFPEIIPPGSDFKIRSYSHPVYNHNRKEKATSSKY